MVTRMFSTYDPPASCQSYPPLSISCTDLHKHVAARKQVAGMAEGVWSAWGAAGPPYFKKVKRRDALDRMAKVRQRGVVQVCSMWC